MRNRTIRERVQAICDKPWNGRGCKSWSHAIRIYMRREERETIARLFEKYGIVYTSTMRRLRMAFKIPWGVPFDLRLPAACPKAGTWNGALEIFCEVMKNEIAERDPARN